MKGQWTREELTDLSGGVIVDVADQVNAPRHPPRPCGPVTGLGRVAPSASCGPGYESLAPRVCCIGGCRLSVDRHPSPLSLCSSSTISRAKRSIELLEEAANDRAELVPSGPERQHVGAGGNGSAHLLQERLQSWTNAGGTRRLELP
jgi:hypothetical protein